MIHTVKFAVGGTPLPKGSKTARIVGKGPSARVIMAERSNMTTKKRRAGALDRWSEAIAIRAHAAMNGLSPWPGAVVASAVFAMPIPAGHLLKSGRIRKGKPLYPPTGDIDKLARAVFDPCSGVVYRDDRQIQRFRAPFEKRWAAPGKLGGVYLEFDFLEDERPQWEKQCDMDLPTM
jgi:hypothetical protein